MTIPIGVLCIDRVPPVETSLSPANGATISGTITVSVTATDNDKVANVQFKLDGSNFGAPITSAPYQVTGYDTHLLANGSHTFAAVATDRVGNVTTVTHTATVSNSPQSSGTVLFGDYQENQGGGYSPGRYAVKSYADRDNPDWIWGETLSKLGTLPIPANTDSTHYQMNIGFTFTTQEGGTGGNIVHVYMYVNGVAYDVFANNPTGASIAVNGGETLYFDRWATIEDFNTCYSLGVGGTYSFAIKSPYLS